MLDATMRRLTSGAFAAVSSTALAIAAAAATPALATPPGQLRCTIVGGFGLFVTSESAVTCTYYRAGDIVEFYTGSSTRVGLDLGPDNARRVVYAVIGADPTAEATLQGAFVGPSAGVSIGEGLSANALLGAGGVTLLPTANAYLTGLNVNAGLSDLRLVYAGSERRSLHSRY